MGQATQAILDRKRDTGRDARASDTLPSTDVGDTRLSVHQDLAPLEKEWRAFQEHADCTVFQTFEWAVTWQQHIGARNGVEPAVVIGRADNGEMLFLLPLAVEARAGARRLTWLGSDLCDYNGPLLAADFSRRIGADRFAELWREITERLQNRPSLRHDLVDLEKMPEAIGVQPNPFLKLGVRLHPSGAYLTHLGGDWDQFYTAKRSSATRRRDRTKLKRLSDFGAVRFVQTDGGDETARTLDIFFRQKARLFAAMGVGNIFADPAYPQFFRALATAPETRQLAHVSRLDVGPTPAAVNLGLIFRGWPGARPPAGIAALRHRPRA
jgi:CelD/BcsL family acetyltransferase involved in cellulose biosynthesis